MIDLAKMIDETDDLKASKVHLEKWIDESKKFLMSIIDK